MAKGANTARIGAFVILGIVLVVAAIAIFGSGRFFREFRQFVMNFTASMQGLNRGSPVMFSGVPIGEVTDIVLAAERGNARLRIRRCWSISIPTGSNAQHATG